jgi:hypothetical protein
MHDRKHPSVGLQIKDKVTGNYGQILGVSTYPAEPEYGRPARANAEVRVVSGPKGDDKPKGHHKEDDVVIWPLPVNKH